MWWLLTVAAVEPLTCPPAEDLVSAERWLRAASLDIRGTIPTPEEYLEVTDPDALPEALLDSWLAEEAFIEEALKQHRGRLRNRFGQLNIFNARNRLQDRNEEPLWVRNRASFYRGDNNTTCRDEPAEDLDGDGRWDVDADGREGWVEVHPYWLEDPTETVRVCGFDAVDLLVAPDGTECVTTEGTLNPDCGCGPNLQFCLVNSVVTAIREDFGNSLDARIGALLREGRPYTDLFTEDRVYVNGPLAHFYRHIAPSPSGVRLDDVPVDLAQLPELDYHDRETWVPVPTHAAHAGMLTDPAFLMRFMTQRARVNRFYEDFVCQPLVAPANGIDLDGEPTLDLSNRGGCAYCHAIIEPAATYWGRFTENGGGFLHPDEYPHFDEACHDCAMDSQPCPNECSRRYTVDPNSAELDPWVGFLAGLQFRDPDEYEHIDLGPGALAEEMIANGRISACLTEKTAIWLLGREPSEADAEQMASWDSALLASDWSYAELVKQIVTSESYRRVH